MGADYMQLAASVVQGPRDLARNDDGQQTAKSDVYYPIRYCLSQT